MSNINTTLLDYLVIVIYLMGIFFLAFKSGKKSTPVKGSSNQSDKDLIHEQYLAGQSLTVPESMFSIIATEVSALTFLGIPAFAYGNDFSFIQIYLGAIIGRIVIARIFLPKVYGKGLTIYSVMGKNGNLQGQRATAIFYFINKLLAVGVRLFSGSILVAEFFNVSIYFAVLVICIITFFYTLIGGLKAVVRTDMVQMGLFIFGGIVAHYMISHLSGDSWFELISNAHAAGKTSFLDFSNPWPFLTGVIGGVLFDMATHGVDQDFAQRLTANKSIKGVRLIDSDNVIILSAIQNRELPKYYNAADIACWPKHTSLSSLEAASCALPIIISNAIICLCQIYILTVIVKNERKKNNQ